MTHSTKQLISLFEGLLNAQHPNKITIYYFCWCVLTIKSFQFWDRHGNKSMDGFQNPPKKQHKKIKLHALNLRATPNQFLNYTHAILLYNVYNSHQPPQDWLSLSFNQLLTTMQNNFEVVKAMNFKVGFNMISNCLSTLNKQIPLQWLNLSLNSYKVKWKTLFF